MSLAAGSSAAPAGPVALSIGSAPLADDASIDRWLSGDASGIAFQQVATGTLDATASGAQSMTTLTAPGTDPALANRATGVYPVLATSGGLTAPSVVVVPADAGAQTPIALVVPITAAP